MTQQSLTQLQEAKLAEALELIKSFEQNAKDLSDLGDAFAKKWEKRLSDLNQTVVQKPSE